MKKQVIGLQCILCKERFYLVGDKAKIEVDKISSTKVHVVEQLPKYCSKCGGYLKPIKKYILAPIIKISNNSKGNKMENKPEMNNTYVNSSNNFSN